MIYIYTFSSLNAVGLHGCGIKQRGAARIGLTPAWQRALRTVRNKSRRGQQDRAARENGNMAGECFNPPPPQLAAVGIQVASVTESEGCCSMSAADVSPLAAHLPPRPHPTYTRVVIKSTKEEENDVTALFPYPKGPRGREIGGSGVGGW